MDESKLDNAARRCARDAADMYVKQPRRVQDIREDCYLAFIKGVIWLQSQSLKDRMKEKEKKELRELYACYKQHEVVCKEKGLYEGEMIARGSTATMRDIFGEWITENE